MILNCLLLSSQRIYFWNDLTSLKNFLFKIILQAPDKYITYIEWTDVSLLRYWTKPLIKFVGDNSFPMRQYPFYHIGNPFVSEAMPNIYLWTK